MMTGLEDCKVAWFSIEPSSWSKVLPRAPKSTMIVLDGFRLAIQSTDSEISEYEIVLVGQGDCKFSVAFEI